jgi:hypothetical protein
MDYGSGSKTESVLTNLSEIYQQLGMFVESKIILRQSEQSQTQTENINLTLARLEVAED